jgi:hypothetical protein
LWARLVDGTGAAAVNDSVILVSGDRITAAAARGASAPGATIERRKETAIPASWTRIAISIS